MSLPCIYGLIDPRTNKVRYVGVTKHAVAVRLAEHQRLAATGGTLPLHRWLCFLSRQNLRPSIVILEKTTDRQRECHWITFYRTQGPGLLNCTDGGDGQAGITVETRRKISAALQGRPCPHNSYPRTAEQKARISATLTGRKIGPFSELHRQRMSDANRGRIISEECKAKLRAANLGKKYSPEQCAQRSAALKGKTKSAAHVQAVARANRGKRHVFSQPHFAAKLTPDQVREARHLRTQEHWSVPRIAAHLQVGQWIIYCLLAGKTYLHVS